MPMDKQQQQSAHHGLPANTPFGSGSTTTSTAPTTLTTAAKDYAKGELFEPEAFFHLYSSCGAMDPWAQADLEQQASPPPGASSEDRANTRMRTRAAGDDPIATVKTSVNQKHTCVVLKLSGPLKPTRSVTQEQQASHQLPK